MDAHRFSIWNSYSYLWPTHSLPKLYVSVYKFNFIPVYGVDC